MVGARRVFVSRTSEFERYPEKGSYVEAASHACNDAGYIPIDMSQWNASPDPPADECRRRVHRSDVYVGIIGFNYGSPVRDNPDKSYTELEYETAGIKGIPRLLFLLDEKRGDMPFGLAYGDRKLTERQESFRKRLLDEDVTVKEFKNPDELRRLVADSLRDLAPSEQYCQSENRTCEPSAPLERPFMVPPSFEPIVDRDSELDDVVSKIREAKKSKNGGAPPLVALWGMGGFGKTTLAAVACRQLKPDFPDGVLWVSLEPAPTKDDLVDCCNDLVRTLFNDKPPNFRDPAAAGGHLGRILGGREVLLVIDDVWRWGDLEPFLRGAPNTVRLITTSVREVLPPWALITPVEQMSTEQTKKLLTREVPDNDADWSALVTRTGQWPLLANLVNGALRYRVKAGLSPTTAAAEIDGALGARGPSALDPSDAEQRDQAVRATIELSLALLQKRLGRDAVDRCYDLAILEGENTPLDLFTTGDNLEGFDNSQLRAALENLSLVQSQDSRKRTVRLRPVLRDYLLSTDSEPGSRSRHVSLLAAHRPQSGRWADLDSGATYLWRWLLVHLDRAGLEAEGIATTSDVAFLSRVVEFVGPSALIKQLEQVRFSDAEKLRTWLRRWSHLLKGLGTAQNVATTLMARPEATDLVTLSNDGSVRPALEYAIGWSCPEPTGSPLKRVLRRSSMRVHTLNWHRDGRRLAAGGGDGRVRIWRSNCLDQSDTDQSQLVPCVGWVRAAAWSIRHPWLMCGDDEGGLHLVGLDGASGSVEVGRHDTVPHDQNSGIRDVAWRPGALAVATASDSGVMVWTGREETPDRSWRQQVVSEGVWVRSIAWSPDGAALAFGDDNGAVSVWNSDDDSLRVLGHHDGEVYSVDWSAHDVLASCGADGALALWDGGRGFTRRDLGRVPGPLLSVSWSPNEDHLVTGAEDGCVRIWDTDGSDHIDLGRHDGGALTVAWHPSKAEVASGGVDGEVKLWQVDGDRGALELRGPRDRVTAVAWSASGRFLATVRGDGAIQVCSADGTDLPPQLIPQVNASPAVAWMGERLAVGCEDGVVRVWRLQSADSPPVVLEISHNGVRSIACSPDGSRLACVGTDGSLQVWGLNDDVTEVLARCGETAHSLAWSPDGRRIVTGDDDGSLRVWVLTADTTPQVLPLHKRPVRAVAWSPCGRWLVAGDETGTLSAWDHQTGASRRMLSHDDAIQAVGFSSIGPELFSVSWDGQLRMWPTPARISGLGLTEVLEPKSQMALARTSICAAWRPTAAQLAIGGSNGLYVFQVRTQEELGSRG